MKWLLWINRVLLTLLSISTGAVKLAQMEAEMVLFRTIGFSDTATILFGVVQLGAGIALIPKPTTRWAAGVMLVTFVFATVVLIVNGMIPFAISSLLFVADGRASRCEVAAARAMIRV